MGDFSAVQSWNVGENCSTLRKLLLIHIPLRYDGKVFRLPNLGHRCHIVARLCQGGLCSLLCFSLSFIFHIFLPLPAPFKSFFLLPDYLSCFWIHFTVFCCSGLSFAISCAPCSLQYIRPWSLLPWVTKDILPALWLSLTGVLCCYHSNLVLLL